MRERRNFDIVGGGPGARAAGIPFLSGQVGTYSLLPTPIADYAGEIWATENGEGTQFPFVGSNSYKYPAGTYSPNSDNTKWIQTPFKVNISEDSVTLLNITDWASYIGWIEDLNIGDKVTYNLIPYINVTGNYTATSPHQDGLNWDIDDENIIRYYNDTGVTIEPFRVLHLKSATVVSGRIHPTPELADASDWEKTQGTLTVSCEQIPPGAFGCSVKASTRLTGGDTSTLPPGTQLWLSDTGDGKLVATKPTFPSFSISMGGNYNQEASPDGEILVSKTREIYDTFNDAWDGAIKESFDFIVTSDGVDITGKLSNKNKPANNLTLLFSDGFNTFDVTTTPKTITLLPGTATSPLINYVYIDQSDKTLKVNSSGFPVTEHAKIAVVGLFNAVTTQTAGAIRNQNINDHIKEDDDNGHILHMSERLRVENARYSSGIDFSLLGTPTNVYINTTAGLVWQLHKQQYPAQDMQAGDSIHVVNDFTTPYRRTTNLNDITAYSDGTTWNNAWSNIVVWGVINKTGEPSHLMVNLPSNGYNSEESAIEDRSNFTNYDIPQEFQGVGFLIGRFTIRPSGGTFTYNGGLAKRDLRGAVPNNTVGGGAGGSAIFASPQYTTTQRDALTPSNGWIIYNTTTNQFEFYENGAWVAK